MQPQLIHLLIAPLLCIVIIWGVKRNSVMMSIVAALCWVQAGAVIAALLPVLSGQATTINLLNEFGTERVGALFAVLTQFVVATCLTHAGVFFKHELEHAPEPPAQLRMFYTCAILLLVSMTGVFFCRNLGALWICVEATTLFSAPLVYYHRNKNALEAAWKYLIICSVGIAFALFGTMFIYASSQYGAVQEGSLNIPELVSKGGALQYPLLRLGFLFCLLGYGTKAGIFPLHSWLPDAHSESPAPASAMLSGSLLNCALFAIWKVSEIVTASGHETLVRSAALSAGVGTVLFASILLIRQHGIKRLFAYSSVENVGLMLTAIGLNSGPLFFILALNHSLVKVALFLICGNIIQSTGTKNIRDIHGLLAMNPVWSGILALGSIAVTGAPPFGAFAAELQLLATTGLQHNWIAMGLLLISLAVSFLAVLMHVGKMICGSAREHTVALPPVASSIVPASLLLVSLLVGFTAISKLVW